MTMHTDRIKELLGNGLSGEVVASTIGVHPSYISQLMSDETFYQEVMELRTKSLSANTVRDRSLDKIEDAIIAKLDDAVNGNLIYKPNDLLRALQVINGAKRRGVSVAEGVVINNTVVQLGIRQQTLIKFTKSDTGEVVQVGDQTLVSMPAANLLSQLAKKEALENAKTGKPSKFESVKGFLPPAALSAGEELISQLQEEVKDGDPNDRRPETKTTIDLDRIYQNTHAAARTGKT